MLHLGTHGGAPELKLSKPVSPFELRRVQVLPLGMQNLPRILRVVDRPSNSHHIKVVRELFCAIEPDTVCLTLRNALFAMWSKGTGEMPVGTGEEEIRIASIITSFHVR
jgi:hypothetical protein